MLNLQDLSVKLVWTASPSQSGPRNYRIAAMLIAYIVIALIIAIYAGDLEKGFADARSFCKFDFELAFGLVGSRLRLGLGL